MPRIKGICSVTNNDARYAREVWPTKFAIEPSVGDFVQAESGTYLKIMRITHYIARIRTAEGIESGGETFTSVKAPRIRVGLGT